MAILEKNLSKHVAINGKCQVTLRANVNRYNRFRVKIPVYVTPELWDESQRTVIIPKLTRKNIETVRIAQIELAQLNEWCSFVEQVITIITQVSLVKKEEIDHLISLKSLGYLKLDAESDIKTLEEAIEAEKADKEKAAFELRMKDGLLIYKEDSLDFADVIPEYVDRHHLSDSRHKGYFVLLRQLKRFEMYNKLTDRATYRLDAGSMTSVDMEKFRCYLRDERTLAQKHPTIFKTILRKVKIVDPSHDGVPFSQEDHSINNRGQNYIIGIIKRLRAVFHWLNESEKTSNYPFKGINEGTEIYGDPVYLTIEERNSLAEHDLSQMREQIQVQRDVFVFQCYVGCRVSDLLRLTYDNVHNGVLTYVPHKTKNENQQQTICRIPLGQRALALIKKYADGSHGASLFPFISSQKYNKVLKEIFKACGLNRLVLVRNPTTGENEFKPLCDLASSHMARRTFVGAAYKVVKDPNLIGAMSGHVPGSRAFARYRKIDDDDLKEVIKAIE